MPYGVLITLTDIGNLVGPFDLYSNLDGYTTPFETNIPASSFVYGYYTTSLPYGTTIIKVKSDGECINFLNLDIIGLPTFTPTATSTPSPTPRVTTSPTNTPSVTPSQTPTIGVTQTRTPTPSVTPTFTPTPSSTRSGYDLYLADKYQCLFPGCNLVQSNVVVALPTGTTPNYGKFYPSETPDGYVYELITTTSGGPGWILNTANFTACADACMV